MDKDQGISMDKEREYLYSLRNSGAKLGISRMRALLDSLGNPQKEYPSILVGGTSGKGSTTAILSSILDSAGYVSGRFTSPHLHRLNERIAVGSDEIKDSDVVLLMEKIKTAIEKMRSDPAFEHPTFFEVITAMAMLYFARRTVDIAVFEVGLGGRLDATNTLDPIVSIITNISLEHTRILGDSVEKIANEKAGIVREGIPLITASRNQKVLDILSRICQKKDSKLHVYEKEFRTEKSPGKESFDFIFPGRMWDGLYLSLRGRHQLENAGCALEAICILEDMGFEIREAQIREGLSTVRWPGRLEVVGENPLIIVDAAKDPEATMRIAPELSRITRGKKPAVLVIGISYDKDVSTMIGNLVSVCDLAIATEHEVAGRSADAEELAKHVNLNGKDCLIIPNIHKAIERAVSIAGPHGSVMITGSVYTAGEARQIIKGMISPFFGRELNESQKGL